MAVVLLNQCKYSEALNIYQELLRKQRDVLGSDHPKTLLTNRNIEKVSKKQAESRLLEEVDDKPETCLGNLAEILRSSFL